MKDTSADKQGRKQGRKKGRHPERVLSPAFVRTAKESGRYFDGHGLYLVVSPTGGRSWIQRLVIHGRRRDLGLGGYPLVSLAEARAQAFANRKLARQGGDPLAEKRKRGGIPTFAEAAMKVIDLHRPTWRPGGRSAEQWESSLRTYGFAHLGDRSVADVTRADVMKVMEPIWHDRHETAKRVLERIAAVMDWAIAQDYRSDNPAGPAIRNALPKHNGEQRRQKALPHAAVAAAIAKVRGSDTRLAAKLAFELLVLSACRSGEVLGARWEEIDLESATWTIPAARMKKGREHRVPLSERAMDVLREAEALDDGSGLVFPSTQRGKRLHSEALSRLLPRLGIAAVPHGFRSSFRDWCSECTDTPHAVAEAAMAHQIPNKAEAAYARSDLFERRRQLMDDWAAYLNPVGRPSGDPGQPHG